MKEKKFELSSKSVKTLSFIFAITFAFLIICCLLHYKVNYLTPATTAIIFFISFLLIYLFFMLIVFSINKRIDYEEKQELKHQRELTCLSDNKFLEVICANTNYDTLKTAAFNSLIETQCKFYAKLGDNKVNFQIRDSNNKVLCCPNLDYKVFNEHFILK